MHVHPELDKIPIDRNRARDTIALMLARSEFRVLSAILQDIAQVFFASIVISPFVSINTEIDWVLIAFGVFGSFMFWWLSLASGKRGNI